MKIEFRLTHRYLRMCGIRKALFPLQCCFESLLPKHFEFWTFHLILVLSWDYRIQLIHDLNLEIFFIEIVEEKLINVESELFKADFEESMRIVIKNHWTHCKIRGCWFHFKQALLRKFNSLPGVKLLLKKSFYARKIQNMTMSILLLPKNQINEGY